MSGRGNSSARGKAAKETEIAQRKAQVAVLSLARMTLREIQAALAKGSTTVPPMLVGLSTLSRDLIEARAAWRDQERVAISTAQEQELAALAKDESRYRGFLAGLKPDEHAARIKYGELILKLQGMRAKLLGTEAPQKIETKAEAVVYAQDVARILADPDATTKLLDAVQGRTLTVPPSATIVPVPASVPPKPNGTNGTNGNGVAH